MRPLSRPPFSRRFVSRPRSSARLAAVVLAVLVALTVAVLLAGCSAVTQSSTGASSFSQRTVGNGGIVTTTTLGVKGAPAGSTPVGLAAADSPVSLGQSPAEMVAALVSPSVVHVRVSGTTTTPFYGDQPYEGVGSGVIYSSDGYIITNDHVVSQNGRPSDDIEVTFATGETVPATIVGRDSYTDIAVIKVDKTELPAATFGRTEDIRIGEYAIAIGSPMDYQNSVTLGIVSGLGRTIEGSGSSSLVDLVQVDAAISPGNSGGPFGRLGTGDGHRCGLSASAADRGREYRFCHTRGYGGLRGSGTHRHRLCATSYIGIQYVWLIPLCNASTGFLVPAVR